ncbi:MAG: hypothetical protein AAF399_08330 [Bacteroidota bacterium]
MNLLLASAIGFAIWLVIAKWLIPSIQDKSFPKSKFAELTKVGWIAALGFLKRFALIASVTYFSLWALLWLVRGMATLFKGSEGVLNGLFSFVAGLNESLIGIQSGKFWFVLGTLGVVFILLMVRNARRDARKVYESLRKEYQEGEVEEWEPSPEMKKVDKQILQTEAKLQEVKAIPPSSLTNQEREQQVAVVDFLRNVKEALQEEWHELNVRRRILPTMTKTAQANQGVPSWKDRLLTFFTSKGLVQTVYKSSKTLGTVGLVCLMLSFLVAAKSNILRDTTATTRQIVALQLQNQQQKLDDQWQENLRETVVANQSTVEEEEPWTEEDEAILNDISRQYELAIARTLTYSVPPVSAAAAFRMRANSVRQSVIRTYATDASGNTRAGFEVVEEGARLESYDPNTRLAKRYHQAYADNLEVTSPRTKVGENFKTHVREKVKGNPGVWNKMKTNYQASVRSFSTAATPKEVLGMMVGESFEELVRGGIQAEGIEGKIAENTLGKTSKRTMRTYMDLKMDQFTDDLVRKPYPEAVEGIAKTRTAADKFVAFSAPETSFPNIENLNQRMANHPACLDHQPLSQNQISRSQSAIRKFSSSRGADLVEHADAIRDFKNYFPGQVGMESESAAARLLGETSPPISDFPTPDFEGGGSGGGGGGGGGGGSSNRKSSARSSGRIASSRPAGRARSFRALRGFRRIGGVLIGQTADNSGEAEADFRDVSWKPVGQQLELFLHRADGEVLSAGVFERDVIHQALAYVADGRLITVTMVTGRPLPFLKILVHPSLVDTDLGCKAIGLDRLVDKYSGPSDDPRVNKALTSFQYQDLLYKYVCLKVVANQDSRAAIQFSSYLTEFEASIRDAWSELYPAMDGGKVLSDPVQSHIAAKPQYYDASLVRKLENALQQSGGRASEFFREVDAMQAYGSVENYLKVETEQWSGVRELAYEVDADLTFLSPSPSDQAQLFPLQFMRQVVYNPMEEEEAEVVDENPWEFPNLAEEQVIEELVWRGIRSNASDRKVLERMKAFALAQRVFRTAMDGDLGLDFPVEKLGDLARETRSSVEEVPTPTWNASGLTWDLMEFQLSFELEQEEIATYKELWDAQEVEAPKNRNPCN